MKKFILHIFLFCVLLSWSIGLVFMQADGNCDSAYQKISSSRQQNLILGISKAAQGIHPQVLKKELGVNFYNYAFTISDSPYGSVYYKSIKQKLDTLYKNQIFILTVDCWSLTSKTADPNDFMKFREFDSFLNQIPSVTQKFNFSYLLNNYNGQYYKLLKSNNASFVHDDGWVEVKLSEDKESVDRRTFFTLRNYENKIEKYKFSSRRFNYLQKTIYTLGKYGKVYLVRLPVQPELFSVENKILPNFNKRIRSVDGIQGYLDLSNFNDKVSFIDGVHLNNKSGVKISERIADYILKQ